MRNAYREAAKQPGHRYPYPERPGLTGDELRALAELQTSRIEAEVEAAVLEARIAAFKDAIERHPVEIPPAVVEQAIKEDPGIRPLNTPLDGARLQEGESLRQKVKARMEEEALRSREEELATMNEQFERVQNLQKAYEDQYVRRVKELLDLHDERLELELIRAELGRAEGVYNLIATRITQLKTEHRAPLHITRLRDAVPPAEPITRPPYLQVALASLSAFCLPFVLTGLWPGFRRLTLVWSAA
jgi:hypothetical protein